MHFALLILTILILLVVLIYKKYRQKADYWKQQNVGLVSATKTIRRGFKLHAGIVISDLYQQMYAEEQPLRVIELLFLSSVVVQDLELIKDILITSYDNFTDRALYVSHGDPLSNNLVRLDQDRWKGLRQKLSPAFTPAKIKTMLPTVLSVGEQLVQVIKDGIASGGGVEVVEVHDLCARFTTDIIGNVAFGIECNSLKEPNCEFRVQGDKGFDLKLNAIFDVMGYKYPKLYHALNIKFFSKDITDFFTRLVRETMEYREKHDIRRNDVMATLIELMKDTSLSLTLEQIVAQAYAFFVGGFDTGCNTLAYALFELAQNQQVQQLARLNAQEVMAKHNNVLTYDSLQDMGYLKQVIQETLRKYPIIPSMSRINKQAYTFKTPNGSSRIPSGCLLIIPIYGIHHNSEFYPQPEEFRPERFTEAEIAKRPAHSYMPFGAGPKVCLGERVAMVELTLGLAMLLTNFRFLACEKVTTKKLTFNSKIIHILKPKDGIYLKVERL